MIKLKKIIAHLNVNAYNTVEETLIKNKADNFLFLLQSYRNDVKDLDIIKKLDLTSNSFYVLKTRLYDKIQSHLSGDIYLNREELLKKLQQISAMCLNEPREVATAFLQKLEEDLLEYDMHNELLIVYSALKKINLYSDKYFHYSQLFNKHIAFSLSLEKSEEILGQFNRVLGQYDFSRNEKLLETLLFLRKEIYDHYSLNPSRQIEIIKNLIDIQLCIFCNTELNKELNVEGLLNQTLKILDELPETSAHKTWMPVLDHLFFEYFFKIGNTKSALVYFTKVNSNLTLLLCTNISHTNSFLISKVLFLQELNRTEELMLVKTGDLIFDNSDSHTTVLLGIYDFMITYYAKNYKEAAGRLNKILNENSFKEYFHINLEVKLALAYVYILMKEYELANSILKGVYRKIKTEALLNYNHVLDLIKVFEADIKLEGKKVTDKQKDHFILFLARNKNDYKLLKYLLVELNKRYT
ncbi:MAG: hypothetical protein JWO32_554 [Bacteroidetes bacterium]|nr:hypothetical protein [Bacteroidota bacterium]